jgi:hypothetical protein
VSVRVELRHHRTRSRLLGVVEVESVAALQRLASQSWVTLDVGSGVRSFRVHGYDWDRYGDDLIGTLWVEP